MAQSLRLALTDTSESAAPGALEGGRLRLRRMLASGPRCPDCAGPLVFGEGCNLCPVCGYSACATGHR